MAEPADATVAGPHADQRRRRKEPLFEDAGGITVVLPSQDHQISKRRLSRQSPIARKIFTFNLLAMGLLMGGVLFLTGALIMCWNMWKTIVVHSAASQSVADVTPAE